VTANLSELVIQAAARSPEGTALVDADGGATVTWAELEDAVARCAAGLAGHGLVAGNRVALAVGNRVELVVLYLAALRARLVAVPVNPRSATGELLRIVADSGARVLVADATTVDPARAVVTGLREALDRGESAAPSGAPRLVVLDSAVAGDEISYDALLTAEPADLPVARDAESIAVLLYTSGTSGRPRAAMLSHRALLANIDQAGRVEPPMVGPDDVVYGVLPLFHVYGLNAVLGQVLARGATIVLVDGFDVESSLHHVQQHGVTVLPVAPPVLQAWRHVPDLGERLAGVRTVMSGSAPLSSEVLEDYATRIGVTVHQGYGLTETAPVLTSTLCCHGDVTAKRGSVGAPLPGVELRLVDDDGRSPETGDPGEIEARGANLFSGYWPDASGGPGPDGWWATGDVGILDGDGDLFLVDRVKELIIVSGFNVYPSEIEEVLAELPEVSEAVVLGVPDERTGEAVVAYLRLADEAAGDEEAALERARRHAETRLARFKWPSHVEVVEEVPRTVTGKVARGRLRARLRRAGSGRVPGVLE
jgi:long-chain acyl-CoA synthetase